MRVLVVGSGGREHTLAWKITQSKRVNKVFCAPGNGGMGKIADLVDIKADDIDGLLKFAKENKIGLTVVGPEVPLVKGIVDRFNEVGLRVFGPSKELAMLEGSKIFAKEAMKRFGLPTADFKVFSDAPSAKKYLKEKGTPVVIKADGLAAGKGVVVAQSIEEGEFAIDNMLVKKIFGAAGEKIIIEDCLEGEEASILVFSDGKNIVPLVSSQDHKRVLDGDQGPNCYSEDTEILTDDGWKPFNKLEKKCKVAVFDPNTREIYFERPLRKYWMTYKGTMINFKNRVIDLLVTSNHRMLVKQRRGKKEAFVVEAKNYRGENYIYQSGIWKGKNAKYFILPEYDYRFNRKFKKLKINFIDWVRFLGVYLSEGYVTKGKGSRRVYICQTKKSRNFNKIRRIINKLPFKFNFEEYHHKFRINSTQLADYLTRFGHSHVKYIPDYVKQAKGETLLEFLKAFNLGDGDNHQGNMRFFSSSRKMIDGIQEVITKLDHSGIITMDRRKTMINPLNKKRYKASPIYSIEMKKRNKTSIRKYNVHLVQYKGNIGCVTTSTGFVVVRRKDRVAISGNTGGMGAYSPAPVVSQELFNKIIEIVFKPIIDGFAKEGKLYKGVLYGGIMITKKGPMVLEFNVRFGDPETQAILPRLKSDLVDVILACIDESLDKIKLEWDNRSCIAVVAASKGYPSSYEKHKEISGLEGLKDAKDIEVFHAGTTAKDGKILTSGGRVLAVTGFGNDISSAKRNAYQAIEKIRFDGIYYRKDIGDKAIRKL